MSGRERGWGQGCAFRAYEAMAPVYDEFTAHHDCDGWVADLLGLLETHGLKGRRLLDVGCGTGKSFLPMLLSGWDVSGCDISPAMLERARAKIDQPVDLHVADMRELPRLGEFDLVWALDDAINYLLSVDELEGALRGMARNLAPDGLILFDVNEILVYRTFYAGTSVVERDGLRLTWRGLGTADAKPSSVSESKLDVDADDGSPLPAPFETSLHRQRHFSETEVLCALESARLECVGVYAHGLDGIPTQPLDTSQHTKAIYLARRAQV